MITRISCFLPFMMGLSLHAAAEEKIPKRPNVILLFSDQHRADAFGFQGNPDALTPNLDSLAKKGVVFNRAYCQDAVSVPSRSSMFTGLYPRTLGILDNTKVNNSVMEEVVSLQTTFQKNGYTTYAFGKRHLDGKADEGWSVMRGHAAKESPEDNYVKWVAEKGYAQEFGEDWAAEFGVFPKGNSLEDTAFPKAPMGTRISRLDEMVTMEAYSALNTIEVIRKHKENKEPFFCFTSFYRPHQPYTPLPKYLSAYDLSRWGEGAKNNSAIVMPRTLRQPPEQLPPLLANLRKNENGIWCLGRAMKDEQLYRNYIGAYYALVAEIDHWVGEILNELAKSGLAENTIVIYASDHGDFIGNHGMIEKAATGHNVFEETLRVPLIFYWEGKSQSNYINNDLVELIDIYPTLMELAGLKSPEFTYPLQGRSIAKTITARKPVGRAYVVSENWSQATVITPTHKLGIWLDPTPQPMNRDFRNFGDMLFEYASDPYEIKNRMNDESLEEVKTQLYKYFADFEKRVSNRGKKEVMELNRNTLKEKRKNNTK